MDAVFRNIGIIVCGLGGVLLCLAIVGFLCWLLCCAWVAFSDRFRAICKAESLIFEFRKYHEQFFAWLSLSKEKEAGDNKENVHDMIRCVLVADAAPVVHGRWNSMDGYKMRVVCSECGWDVPEYGKFYSYCPNCGAKMDLEEDTCEM